MKDFREKGALDIGRLNKILLGPFVFLESRFGQVFHLLLNYLGILGFRLKLNRVLLVTPSDITQPRINFLSFCKVEVDVFLIPVLSLRDSGWMPCRWIWLWKACPFNYLLNASFTPNLLTKMRKQTNELSCSEDTGSQKSRGSNWKSTGECLK